MTTRAVEAIDDWESEPFSGGYAGLRDLVDEEFSGVVQAGAAKLCLTHGTAVGVLDGTIEDFEDASGTVFTAPSPALPLLAWMQANSDDVRAKYYTEDTPVSEVDRTLSNGGFSGYVELSENVLSGDYYVVYHRGRSMAVAWVGNAGQLLTDDEAFERADDEVGIYKVRQVEVEPVEIPESDGGARAGAADAAPATAGSAVGAAGDEAEDADPDAPEAAESPAAPTDTDPETDPAAEEPPADPAADEGPAEDHAEGAVGQEAVGATESTAQSDADDPVADAETGAAEADDPTGRDSEPVERASEPDDDREPADTTGSRSPGESGRTDAGRSGSSQQPSADRRAERSTGRDRQSDADRSRSERERPSRTDRGSTEDRTDAGQDESQSPASARSQPSGDQSGRDTADRTRDTTAETRAEPERGSAGRRETDPAETGGTPRSAGASTAADRSPDEPGGATGAGAGGDDLAPADRLETRSIPSLDPTRTTSERADEEPAGVAGGPTAASADAGNGDSARPETAGTDAREVVDRSESRQPATDGAAREPSGEAGRRGDRNGGSPTGASAGNGGVADAAAGTAGDAGGPDPRVSDLEDDLAATEAELDRVESDLAAVESERDELRRERDDLREERDALAEDVAALEAERDDLEAELADAEAELDRLRTELDQLEAEFGAATDAERRLSRGEALEATNLFVRYESKGKATLESARDGNASREEVGANLGLEYHTQFEAGNVSVAGQPFDEFLESTIQYRFVTWVVNDLLYEIRDTGTVAALQGVYDAIPQIDRAELGGSVSVEYTEDGQQRRSQESFDVVMRDRMGNALLVANLNDSRQAATESMMNTLVTAASHVGESEDSLAGSFLVTSSFFEPEALETAAEATSGGLLSRDKRESFVKLSRKRGYHLCLAEAREGKFHLAVPEL